jgi:hypothetical protein
MANLITAYAGPAQRVMRAHYLPLLADSHARPSIGAGDDVIPTFPNRVMLVAPSGPVRGANAARGADFFVALALHAIAYADHHAGIAELAPLPFDLQPPLPAATLFERNPLASSAFERVRTVDRRRALNL